MEKFECDEDNKEATAVRVAAETPIPAAVSSITTIAGRSVHIQLNISNTERDIELAYLPPLLPSPAHI